jgi:8-oxo-dGTP pyrophosphatase MutT (NUDIX family)
MNDIQMVHIVAGCVLVQDGKYLLVQEKQQKAYGLWNLPAGRVDTGESIEDAAIREAKEEAGFDVTLGEKISIEHASSTQPVLHAFKADIVSGELQFDPEELLDAKWFSLDEIKALDSEGKIRNGWALRVIEQAR